jgi:type I restriction enzyme S subunit
MRATKDSGVDWLGEIPADWVMKPCWSYFRRVKQTGLVGEELLSVYRDHGVVPKASRDDNHNVESEDLSSYQLVRVGDMVMNKMKAWQGSIALSDFRGIVSPAYFVYRPTHEFSRKYFHYLMRSAPYIGEYNRISKGVRIGQWDLDPTYFRTTQLIVPPPEEQQAIADFLDRETAKIDTLIAKQDQLIRTLGERRQAIVTSSITQGLVDRNPLEHSQTDANSAWRQVKIGHLFEVIGSGTTPQSDRDEYYGGAIPWVTTGELRESKILETSKNVSDLALKEHSALRIFPAGSLVIALYGATIGRLGTLGVSSTVNQACCVLSGPKGVRTRFVYYALLAGRSLLLAEAVGGSQPNISQEAVRQFKILVPPSNQQDLITENLDAETTKIDQLIDVAKNTNQKFLERRQSLISAAVTGKIDLSEGA